MFALLGAVHESYQQRVRLGIRTGDRPTSMLAVDSSDDVSPISPDAKPLPLQVLADRGLQIGELEKWKAEASGTTISLAGAVTTSGLRRVMTLMECMEDMAGARWFPCMTRAPTPRAAALPSSHRAGGPCVSQPA